MGKVFNDELSPVFVSDYGEIQTSLYLFFCAGQITSNHDGFDVFTYQEQIEESIFNLAKDFDIPGDIPIIESSCGWMTVGGDETCLYSISIKFLANERLLGTAIKLIADALGANADYKVIKLSDFAFSNGVWTMNRGIELI